MIHFFPRTAGAFSHASRTRSTMSAMSSYVVGAAVGPDGDRLRRHPPRGRGSGSRRRGRSGTAGSRCPGPGCRPRLACRGTSTGDPRLGPADDGVRPGPPRRGPHGAIRHTGPRRRPGPCLLRGQGRGPRSCLDRTRQHRRSPLRTTYEPVRATVKKGDKVTPGDIVGVVEPTGSHCQASCLHWGLLRADTYLDPLSLLPPWLLHRGPSRLLPVIGVPERPPA